MEGIPLGNPGKNPNTILEGIQQKPLGNFKDEVMDEFQKEPQRKSLEDVLLESQKVLLNKFKDGFE